jgi:hypothetical protein
VPSRRRGPLKLLKGGGDAVAGRMVIAHPNSPEKTPKTLRKRNARRNELSPSARDLTRAG